jgi:hypothetical protein
MARPRVLAPKYGSAEHVQITSVVNSTSPGRPQEDVTRLTAGDTLAGLEHPVLELTGEADSTVLLPPRRTLPPPVVSDPALLSSFSQSEDLTLDDQVNQLQKEVEIDKERRRMVSGLDTEDLNAMLRAFDKVRRRQRSWRELCN